MNSENKPTLTVLIDPIPHDAYLLPEIFKKTGSNGS
jgi:hypothetical protein